MATCLVVDGLVPCMRGTPGTEAWLECVARVSSCLVRGPVQMHALLHAMHAKLVQLHGLRGVVEWTCW